MYSPDYRVLQRYNDDWFVIFTSKSLGELEYIQIWHDSCGRFPIWYCKRIEVTCVRDNKKWNFRVKKWFSILNSIDDLETSIPAGQYEGLKYEITENVKMGLGNEILLYFG